ncbi:acyl-CoA dehydrogenase family protein [Sinimarinibacterium thermocellulolyticum]|uniref:Acyl-CoA dehydrogenase family protein n=1 Tax=Sinimarinibacterium thermocellulolyticum TaxID=3170016 RepID=A0ABV2A7K2_9GAMM
MTPELAELRDSARQVLAAEGLAAPEDKTWPLARDLGWLLVAVPEAQGGLGQGLAGACAFHVEMGRSLCAAPYLPAMLAMEAVIHAGREDWIERLGSTALATASLADATDTPLTISDDKVVSGAVTAVPSADRAGHVLVCSAAGDAVALVPLAQPGVTLRFRESWDTTRRLFDLRFDGVALDPSWVLARGDEARVLGRRLATHRDFALAADAVGGAAAALEMTIEYLKTRRQFGRPLALFQALKHRCADLKARIAAAEALLADSIVRVGTRVHGAEAERLGKAVKHFATAAYAAVAEDMLQLHGGIGMTAEHACHLFLKRALLNEQLGRRSSYELDIADALLQAS